MEKVQYEKRNRVAVITLQDEKHRNAMSSQLTAELVRAFHRANDDATIGAIVLTGSGSSFCAGGDLTEFQEHAQTPLPQLYEEGLESTEVFQMRDVLNKPIIGAINGAAFGGGTGLVALCHIAIGSEKAKLGLTEISLGLVPYIIMPLVRRAVGERQMMDLMLSARILSAQEAKEVGLLHRVVPEEELLYYALKEAESIANRSALAVKMALRSFEETTYIPTAKAMRSLSTLRLISFKSKDLKEGADAFMEKRQPKWSGK